MINDKKEMFTIKWDRAGRTAADAGFFLLRVLRKSENMNEETKDTLKKVAEFTAEENRKLKRKMADMMIACVILLVFCAILLKQRGSEAGYRRLPGAT